MFRKCIKIAPTIKRSHIALITLLSDYGTQNERMDAINNANHFLPDDISVLTLITEELLKMNNDLKMVENICKHILKLEPKQFSAHIHLAIVYQRLNIPEKSIEYYEMVQRKRPGFHIKDQDFNRFLETQYGFSPNQKKNKKN